MIAHSEQLAELTAALVKAQKDFPTIEPTTTGQVGTRSYKYANLASILHAVQPALTANGLAVLQTCEPSSPNSLRVTTTLLHTSGQYLEGTAELPLANNTPQGYGSAMTYARRYQLSAILGIASDDDDDGHEASQQTRSRARTAAPARQEPPAAPGAQHVPYADMTVKGSPEIARRWFIAKLKEDCDVNYEQAKALLEVDSIQEQFPMHTFGQVLGFVKVAKLRQAKATADAELAH